MKSKLNWELRSHLHRFRDGGAVGATSHRVMPDVGHTNEGITELVLEREVTAKTARASQRAYGKIAGRNGGINE